MSELKQSDTEGARKILWYCQKYMPPHWIESYNRAIKSICEELDNQAGHSGGANGMINEPLTLEELMDMDGEPVCVLWPGGEVFWCLCHEGWITPPSCIPFAAEDCPRCTFYRQKPEGE